MTKVRRRLRNIDIFIAMFAGGSGVAGFALWNYSFWGVAVGQFALGFLIGISIVLAIVKPYLKWDDQLERQSAMHGIYASLAFAHKDNVQHVKASKAVDQYAQKIFDVLRDQRGMHLQKEDSPKDDKLTDEMQDKVNKRYPKEYFYYPEVEGEVVGLKSNTIGAPSTEASKS